MKLKYTSRYVYVIFFLIGVCFTSCKEKDKNEIQITKSQALQIAKRYGITGNNVKIYFDTYTYSKITLGYKKGKRKLYYWYVSKECNHCPFIQIDAVTGNVFSEGKYNYAH